MAGPFCLRFGANLPSRTGSVLGAGIASHTRAVTLSCQLARSWSASFRGRWRSCHEQIVRVNEARASEGS